MFEVQDLLSPGCLTLTMNLVQNDNIVHNLSRVLHTFSAKFLEDKYQHKIPRRQIALVVFLMTKQYTILYKLLQTA